MVTGPQHGCLSAGIKLGKMAGLVGWRLPGKRRCVVQGEGASEGRLRLHHQGGCQNAPQEDCKWSGFRGQAGLPKREPQQLEGDISERWCLPAWGSQAYTLAQKQNLSLGGGSSGS